MSDPISKSLVPRHAGRDYSEEAVEERRRWAKKTTGASLDLIGKGAIPPESMRGNIENAIGTVQMPLGVAGPLWVRGEHADGIFYVPLATTEGALVRSYERGMVMLTQSGGVEVRIERDENLICPVFQCATVGEAAAFAQIVRENFEALKRVADATTRHGKLIGVEPHVVGRDVQVAFRFHTGDAHGMNMVVKAADAACRWLMENGGTESYLVFSGLGFEKRPSASALRGGKGKRVVAGALIPAKWVRLYLHTTPGGVRDLWQRTVVGNIMAGSLGYCGHFANGLTAMFIACGQDVANVVNSAIGLTNYEVTAEGDLYASVTLPSLVVATVGGGVDLGTSRECLEMLGCHGAGKAKKLAEIAAATVLAGELSFAGSLISGEFAAAHEEYGRNRPQREPGGTS